MITKDEYEHLVYLEKQGYEWIARGDTKLLLAFKEKPTKIDGFWKVKSKSSGVVAVEESYEFDYVSYKNEEPTNISILMTHFKLYNPHLITSITDDKINHPNHYQGINNLEVLEVHENFLPKYDKYGALVGAYIFNAIKYILRAPDKNGIEDLKKARFYLDEVIKHLEDNQ